MPQRKKWRRGYKKIFSEFRRSIYNFLKVKAAPRLPPHSMGGTSLILNIYSPP